ncbi:hypothetical protein ABVT39_013372 [Epinephelus coioides]
MAFAMSPYIDTAGGGKSRQARAPGYRPHNKVFSKDQENKLQAYLKRAAEIYFGLSRKEVRKFVYDLAERYGCKYPNLWKETQMAGKDWLTSFLECNRTLSVCKPQATSMSRSTSFNWTNDTAFYTNLKAVLARHHFEAKDIWNMDETGTTTVQVPDKIVATKGQHQVSAMTFRERGTLVTVAFSANARGNFVPPYFIFPRKKFQDHFIQDGPVGCTGSANGSGWMQEADFLAILHHFARQSRCDPGVNAIDFCKSQGIVMLSFPPHCSHRLQPLDRSVFGPLKHYINCAADNWMRMNLGKCLTIYNIPLPRAMTASNISSGFECSSI